MNQGRKLAGLRIMLTAGLATSVLGDGMVFAPVYFPKVEIPNQQALIHFAEGRERLVIETTFLGQGTNFAWVVPLPSVPDVKPAPPELFDHLRESFRPRLIHPVSRYYLGLLFLCGWAFLGWRSLQDEVSWVTDLPLCLLLAGLAWYGAGNILLGGLAFLALLYVRILTGSVMNLTLGLLVGLGAVVLTGIMLNLHKAGLIQTLGDTDQPPAMSPQVTILAQQRAGIFDTTTIKGDHPQAVLEWLEQNGFAAPGDAAEVIRQYVERGWVFVAAKARLEQAGDVLSALHPLAFSFATPSPVYPLQLTGINPSECRIDLYVFSERRAKARHFSVIRCDRIASQESESRLSRRVPRLLPLNPAIAQHIGVATVGTKLSGTLTPAQMKQDARITWAKFSRVGANVYSYGSAATVAINVAVTLAVIGWLAVEACRGGWGVTDKFVRDWRWRMLPVSVAIGLLVFALLPKVEIDHRGSTDSFSMSDQ